MEKIVSYLDKEGKELILLGDTNCDFGNKEKDHLTDNYAKLLSNIYNIYGLKQLIEDPTLPPALLLLLTTLQLAVPQILPNQGYMRSV